MSYLNQMYGRKSSPTPSKSEKNPNRVAGGLRAQGADMFEMLGETKSTFRLHVEFGR